MKAGLVGSIVGRVRVVADKLCPPRQRDQGNVLLRLEGFAYGYTMLWTLTQITGFVCLLIAFLFSDNNIFMKTEDCCTDLSVITDDVLGIPIEQCSQESCRLYTFTFNGDKQLIQDRPRHPYDGDHSLVFTYEGDQYCCNLHESSKKCCDKLPFRRSCGAVMWVACFSAVCSMLMVQVILQGFYSFSSRRSPYWVFGAIFPAILMRCLLFFFVFYIFWGFMFTFMCFWVAMFYCDNPHAWRWYEFGFLYLKYFFVNAGVVWEEGFTEWDGNMDLDSTVGSYTVFSLCTDLVFSALYVLFNRYEDRKHKKYLDLTYFSL